jgi:hypothetical protein
MIKCRQQTMFCVGECSNMMPVKRYCMWAHHFIYAYALPIDTDELEHLRGIAKTAPGGCVMYTKVDSNTYDYMSCS